MLTPTSDAGRHLEGGEGEAAVREIGAGADEIAVGADELAVAAFLVQIDLGGVAVLAQEDLGQERRAAEMRSGLADEQGDVALAGAVRGSAPRPRR